VSVSTSPAGVGVAASFVSGARMRAGRFDHAPLRTLPGVALAALVVALPAALRLLGRGP
jgi:hypothetical protein